MTAIGYTATQVLTDQWDIVQNTPLPAQQGIARVGNPWSTTMTTEQLVPNPASYGAYGNNTNNTTSPLDSDAEIYSITNVDTPISAAPSGLGGIVLNGTQRTISIRADSGTGDNILKVNNSQQCFPITWADALPAWANPRSLDYLITGGHFRVSGSSLSSFFKFASADATSLRSHIVTLAGVNRGNAHALGGGARTQGAMTDRVFLVSTLDNPDAYPFYYRSSGADYFMDTSMFGSFGAFPFFYTGTTSRQNAAKIIVQSAPAPAAIDFLGAVSYYSLGSSGFLSQDTVTFRVTATLALDRILGGTSTSAWIYDGSLDPFSYIPAGTIPFSIGLSVALEGGGPFNYGALDLAWQDLPAYPTFPFGDPICEYDGSVFVPGRAIQITA